MIVPRQSPAYEGVLALAPEAIHGLAEGEWGGGGAGLTVTRARLSAGRLLITWAHGHQSAVSWAALRRAAGLAGLPPPRLAFLGPTGDIYLVFREHAPCGVLRFREPHSVVHSLGRLLEDGLVPAP